jgi:hypothetical protein
MIELYFILYRVPKMMTALARERQRSALLWSLVGIFAWLGAEIAFGLAAGIGYGLGQAAGLFPTGESPLFLLLLYVGSLASAVGGFTLVRGVLRSMPVPTAAVPPPPPSFV